MASLAFDGQSFSIDGKRIFLVGGTIHYARLPRATWADRIAAAKSLGLNCITVPVVWARHETRPGQFDFAGENDLRHFIQLIDKAGMYAVLRIGPFIGSGYDLGGMPAWLTLQKDVQMRVNSSAFLECCSRYFSHVAQQVRDLQVSLRTSKPAIGAPVAASGGHHNGTHPAGTDQPAQPAPLGGPIVLIQSECQWTCGVDEMAAGYLGELNRYLRESGLDVPVINANQLWQAAEGEIDTWTGRSRLIQDLRQLSQVRANQPRMLSQYLVTEAAAFGDEQLAPAVSPDRLLHDLAEVLAAGAQFNVEPLCAGTSFGFSGGKLPGSQDDYLVPHTDAGAPLDLAGNPGPLAEPLRRLATFASSFSRVMSHIDVRRPTVSVLPAAAVTGTTAKGQTDGPTSIVHLHGAQGGVVFIFRRPGDAKTPARPVDLLLPDGSAMQVFPGHEQVNWLLLDARLAGRATLDFSNLTPLATVGRVLVMYGQPESTALVSINGSTVEFTVPADKEEPVILEHEGVILVVGTKAHLGSIQIVEDGVYLNCDKVTISGEPVVHKADAVITRISDHGVVSELKFDPRPKVVAAATPEPEPVAPPKPEKGKKVAKAPVKKVTKGKPLPPPPPAPVVERTINVHLQPVTRTGTAPHLAEWTAASTSEHCAGESARYASIGGPADLAQMGAAYGYGWYRIKLDNSGTRKLRVAWPGGGDRLSLFTAGEPLGTVGHGPGADDHAVLTLKKGEQNLVILAENLGRLAGTTHIGQVKDGKDGRGCVGHAVETVALKVAKPTLVQGKPVDAGAIKGLLLGIHKSDTTEPDRVRFSFPHKKKTGVLVRIKATTHRGIILLDDAPLRNFDSSGPGWIQLTDEQLGKGTHVLEFAVFGDTRAALAELSEAVTFEEVLSEVTAEAEWAFAKWEMPHADSFSTKVKTGRGTPVWQRSSFTLAAQAHAPLYLDLTGLSKGQLYINGKHLCRYFVATGAGRPVGPQTTVLIPDAMLHHGTGNEVTIFDEHGHSAAKVRIHH